MGVPTKLISYEDSLGMPENRLEEIVHGESRIMPPVTLSHAWLIRRLSRILELQLDPLNFAILGSDVGLGMARHPLTYRIPDLMVYRLEALRQGRAHTARTDPYIWTAPELLVECLSPSNRKGAVQELLGDYDQIAVPEVWLFDPALPRFTSYVYEGGALRELQSMETGMVAARQLPVVGVDLSELWSAFFEGPGAK